MSRHRIATLAVVTLCATARVDAQSFVGLSTVSKEGAVQQDCGGTPCPPIDCNAELDVEVCNLYANFDAQFPFVKLLSVGFSNIAATAPFYQHPFGLDTAPLCAFIPIFPDLQCDSFVTVGRRNNCPGDQTLTDADFYFFESTVVGGWFNADTANDQGHPQPGPLPGVHQVLIAQFSVPRGHNVSGTLAVFWQAPDGGTVVGTEADFTCFVINGPCEPQVCDDGNPCTQDLCDPDDPGADANGCLNPPQDAGTACELDGDLCTIDQCDGGGNCAFVEVVSCPGPQGPCDGGQACDSGTGECLEVPGGPPGAPCEGDDDVCTLEQCDGAGVCVFFANLDCDDGNACTDDLCDARSGCLNPIGAGFDCAGDADCGPAKTCSGCLCVSIEVPGAALDIKPGSCPNPLNLFSRGVLPVALLGSAKFDVGEVVPGSVELARADGVGGSVSPLEGPPGPHSVLEDVGAPFAGEGCLCHDLRGDGFVDLSMKFRVDDVVEVLQLAGLGGQFVELVVSGLLADGFGFSACDCVLIVPARGLAPLNVAVQSTVSDTYIDVTPVDLNLDGGGFANFQRAYHDGTQVSVTAPWQVAGWRFARWEIDGVPLSWGRRTIAIAVSAEMTLRALYEPLPPIAPTGPPSGL